jgi:hypothetical protein
VLESASSAACTVLVSRIEVLGPVRRNPSLNCIKRYVAGFYLVRKIVLDAVLDFEVAVLESHVVRPTLRPDVAHAVRTAQFERNQVVEFANLVASGVMLRIRNLVPAISDVLSCLALFTVP